MKVLVAFGTRPEAIKLAPVIRALAERPRMEVRVVTTAQHRELLDQVLDVFHITPDVDLDVMEAEQTLASLSARVLTAMDRLLRDERPDVVIIQGDTTSAMMCALAAFYRRVPVGHVEAGLRTISIDDPFPEEMNRRLASVLAAMHFAPTERARQHLVADGVPPEAVFVTGNPVVDALQQIRLSRAFREVRLPVATENGTRLLLATLHRRESWGAPLTGMCRALRTIVERHGDVRLMFPVHLNPSVRRIVDAQLGGVARVTLLQPLDYVSFVRLMEASWMILTDSGGVQEEAPTLGTPVLVLRNTTERPEAVEQGVARLVGTDPDDIVAAASEVLASPTLHARMARPVSPFGDGHAAARIADVVARFAPSEPLRAPTATMR
jgi:UDP-N-acetylglucosamine 2-epimerase (non-hydrolysing)